MKKIPQLERIQRALGELTPARRVLAGTLVAVMIATGVWTLTRSSGGTTVALEPVLDQPFTETELARIAQHLRDKSVTYEVRDGKVHVPGDRRLDVLSELSYAGVLNGGGMQSGFDALVKQMTAWDAPSKTEKMFNHLRETTVEQIIANHPSVRKATVIIDPTNQRHLGGESVQPVAMVDIQTRRDGSANARQLSQGAVNVITGCIANMSPDRVKVTIDGAVANVGDPVVGATQALIERKQQCEQLHAAKVRQLLSYIPGDVLISVSVDVSAESENAANSSDRKASAEAAENTAVVANAVPIAAESAKAPSLRLDTVRSASVAVPRSYFVKIYLGANTLAKEPTDALLQPIVDARTSKIKNLVKNALGLEDDDSVTVEPYEDALPPALQATVASGVIGPDAAATGAVGVAIPFGFATNLNTYAKQIALATLAAVALLLLALLVRRRPTPVPVMVDAPGRQRSGRDAAVLNGTLEGTVEARSDEIEPHQLFRRVRDLASDHPEDAARVLRHWIYQD